MASATPIPMTALHFSVSWEDDTSAFSEVSGLTAEAEVVEYRAGTDVSLTSKKIPGLKKFGNVTLKRGIMSQAVGNGLYAWYDTIRAGNVTRRSVIVQLLNEDLDPVMTWEMRDAWPVKLEGPALKSTGTDVAIETVEFAHEGFKITIAGG
jgi:phage tail-like protein